MTDRPIVAVYRATEDDPPPGIDAAAQRAELRLAGDVPALRRAIVDAEALFSIKASWSNPKMGPLEEVWPDAGRLRWVQTASDGVDLLLFPALVESRVMITNARGVFDDSIAEWALVVALALTWISGLDYFRLAPRLLRGTPGGSPGRGGSGADSAFSSSPASRQTLP